MKQKIAGFLEQEAELGSDNEQNDHLIKVIPLEEAEEQDSETPLESLI